MTKLFPSTEIFTYWAIFIFIIHSRLYYLSKKSSLQISFSWTWIHNHVWNNIFFHLFSSCAWHVDLFYMWCVDKYNVNMRSRFLWLCCNFNRAFLAITTLAGIHWRFTNEFKFRCFGSIQINNIFIGYFGIVNISLVSHPPPGGHVVSRRRSAPFKIDHCNTQSRL